MFHMLSELPLLNKVGADIVLEYGNVNSFLNLFNPYRAEPGVIQYSVHRRTS